MYVLLLRPQQLSFFKTILLALFSGGIAFHFAATKQLFDLFSNRHLLVLTVTHALAVCICGSGWQPDCWTINKWQRPMMLMMICMTNSKCKVSLSNRTQVQCTFTITEIAFNNSMHIIEFIAMRCFRFRVASSYGHIHERIHQ